MRQRRADLSNQFFGRLFAIENIGKDAHGSSHWWCHCECGNFRDVRASSLMSGAITSCGCLKREKLVLAGIKHGQGRHPAYMTWWHMIDRCTNPSSPDYKRYGGRGITICEEWFDIKNFISWADENGYAKGLELDRIDNNAGYGPENCRFADRVAQSNNRRNNAYLSVHGISKTISQWSNAMEVDSRRLRYMFHESGMPGWNRTVA